MRAEATIELNTARAVSLLPADLFTRPEAYNDQFPLLSETVSLVKKFSSENPLDQLQAVDEAVRIAKVGI